MKKSTEYLYNCKPSKFSNLPYTKALEMRVLLAKKLLDELINVNLYARDDQRLKDVLNAKRFNEDLLMEIYDNDTKI